MFSGVRKSVAITVGALGVAVFVYGFYSRGVANHPTEPFTIPVVQGAAGEQPKSPVELDVILDLVSGNPQNAREALNKMNQSWDISYVPIILESVRFMPPQLRMAVFAFLGSRTGQDHGRDFDAWYHWIWKQEFEPHSQYGQFKASLYQRIDPRFSEYFQETENSTIRLDEIRWGGVVRDGIPPLKNPKMLPAADARYLGDDDVVFGIKLNGDARCYPKRILAWHEMFKDTIGGESVCGVY